MEESIFFNLGNAIASNYDTKELARTAQIEYSKRKLGGHLVIVKDPETGEQFLFDTSDQLESAEDGKPFVEQYIVERKE
ncbi:hypothetical protein [Enterococcus mediterraneensis]|uniref:hypothetical protein n=1 Tax=Enterococcus mediterraneensis TaxID=2364791 RepID=UPI000F071F70|nr:hypothetical protein [Enterococcus mediterraneensis]